MLDNSLQQLLSTSSKKLTAVKTPFSIYRIVRIDGTYDTDTHSEETLKANILEALNNLPNYKNDDIEISAILDCGESM